jgi:hypothetical protein
MAGDVSVSIAVLDENRRIEIPIPFVLSLAAYTVGIVILIVFAGVCPPLRLVPVVVKTNEYFIVMGFSVVL